MRNYSACNEVSGNVCRLLLIMFANNFDPGQCQQNVSSDLDPDGVSESIFFKKVIFFKNQQTTKACKIAKHANSYMAWLVGICTVIHKSSAVVFCKLWTQIRLLYLALQFALKFLAQLQKVQKSYCIHHGRTGFCSASVTLR